MKPTSKENTAKINALFDKLEETMANLASRWEDEKQYEDIKDYGEVIVKLFPSGFKLIKMIKRPFGFQFTIEGTEAHYTMTMTPSGQYSWGRIS